MRESACPIRLIWPPPGLEGCQGVLWRKGHELGSGAAILVFPLLFSVTWPHPFNSLGLFGTAWWVLGSTSLIGLWIIIRALSGLLGFFWKAGRALGHRIDLETALQVGADREGDMGALLQGIRGYEIVEENARARAVRARIVSVLLFLSAATWLTLGWVISLLLATRGLLGPTGVWVITLGPSGLTLIAGAVARAYGGTAVQAAHGPWFWERWRSPGRMRAARLWGEGLRSTRPDPAGPGMSERSLKLAGIVSVFAMGALTVVPTVSLSLATASGSLLATIAAPSFPSTQRRAGIAEAFRRLRLAPDPGISPLKAGEALHVLSFAGRRNLDPEWFKTPARHLEDDLLPDGWRDALGLRPQEWPTGLFPMVSEGMTPEGEAFLRKVADHPGLAEFETLARAEAMDVFGASLALPLPEDVSALNLPIPSMTPSREGSYAMIARAAIQLMDGDPNGAELTLRTILSAGLLMGDESPTLIGSLIGYVLTANAGDALISLYEASGRREEAEALRWVRETAEVAAKKAQGGLLRSGAETAYRTMSAEVLDETQIRALRWEYFMLLGGLSPCINPRQVVFGSGSDQAEFMRSARSSLVRYPADAVVFDVMKKGFFDLEPSGSWRGALAGIVTAALGEEAGKCAGVLASGMI